MPAPKRPDRPTPPTTPPTQPRRPDPQPLPPSGAGPQLAAVVSGASATDMAFERLLGERIVFLAGEIDDETAGRITAQLLLLTAEDPHRDIAFYINSAGGSVTAGLAIHDTMQLITPDVATWAVGLAASMGQVLLSAGAPGKRYALPHARVVLHQPSSGMGGTASDVRIRAAVLGELKHEIAELTARHTGQSVDTIVADSDRDRWFTAAEAQAYGLVDHVAGT